MFSHTATVDFIRSGQGTLPTPDALMVALLEQQKLLENKDKVLEENSTKIKNQQALIAVLEERLRLKDQRLFGAEFRKYKAGAASIVGISSRLHTSNLAPGRAESSPDSCVQAT